MTPEHKYWLSQYSKEKKTYSGEVTEGTRKRILRTVELLLQTTARERIRNTVTGKMMSHWLSFVTLTMPTDKQMSLTESNNKLLAPWVRKIKNDCGLKTYIWKLEFQERGVIHYHLTTPTFIEHTKVRDTWNNILRKNDLLNNHSNPNSTDIHEVVTQKDMAKYLCKYISKAIIDNHHRTGKIWDCSENLKGKKYFTVELNRAHELLLLKLADEGKVTVDNLEHCAIIKPTVANPTILLSNQEKNDYSLWKKSTISFNKKVKIL